MAQTCTSRYQLSALVVSPTSDLRLFSPSRRLLPDSPTSRLASAHVVAEGVNGVAVMLAEDREGRLAEMLTRIADGGGPHLPFKLGLHLAHVLGLTGLDRRLD